MPKKNLPASKLILSEFNLAFVKRYCELLMWYN
jgi:hypothetical protein